MVPLQAKPPIAKEDIPVLLTVFNRPEKTKTILDNLRRIRPRRLFVAADGPRPHVPGDAEKCRLAREAATRVDWDCTVTTRFSDRNLGCDPAVSSAIDWFFEQVEHGIILEDDCLIHPDFFTLCGELLVRYGEDLRIMQISSLSPYEPREHPFDYHFSRMFRCSGGWATWRRAWEHFTPEVSLYPDRDLFPLLKAYYPDHSKCRQVYRRLQEFKEGKHNFWDFQWNLACYSQNGLSVVPERNLMENIGFDDESTHTVQINAIFEGLKAQPLTFPLRHPPFVYADLAPELGLERRIYRRLPFKSRCKYLLLQLDGVQSYLRDALP